MSRPRRRVRLGILFAVAALAGALNVVAAVPATADEVITVGSGGLAMTGHGWGHGIGLSAWGEQGAALQGKTYGQILDFYYPGTTRATRTGTMAVRIDDAGTSQTAVAATAGLQAADLGDGATWTLPSGPSQWRVRLQSSGAGWIESLTGSTWTKWLPPDGRAYLKGILRFQNGPISIVLSGGTLRKVRGVVDAIGTGNGALMTVNTLGLEDYVRSVDRRRGAVLVEAGGPQVAGGRGPQLRGLEARPRLRRLPGLLDGRLPGLSRDGLRVRRRPPPRRTQPPVRSASTAGRPR